MAEPLILALISVVLVSVFSFIGVLALSINENLLKKLLIYFVGFSAGALLGDSFLHLLPEVVETLGFTTEVSLCVLAGMATFFLIEKLIQWRHCHIPPSKTHPHTFAYMNLIGDGVHNFIDGVIIGASYLVSVPVGIATTIAVIFHEIPQEIGDFGVLLHGGFSRSKALAINFLSAVTAVIGAMAAVALSSVASGIIPYLGAFAAGGFIYIASTDLIPELHKKFTIKSAILQIIAIGFGVLIMYGLLLLE